ncbi:hypothetical protein D3C81_1256870 [compost metagenome]
MADLLDQATDTAHGFAEALRQFAQFIAAVGLETDRHVTGRHLVHRAPQLAQRRAGRHIEAPVEVKDQRENACQHSPQGDHAQALLAKALLQLKVQMPQYFVVQLVGVCHQFTHLLIEGGPGRIKGFSDHHTLLEQRGGLLDGKLAGLCRGDHVGRDAGVTGQGFIHPHAIVRRQTLQALQQVFEADAAG